MKDLVVRFQDTNIRIIDANGERWAPVADIAMGMGFERTDYLIRLMRRNWREFEGKAVPVKLTSTDGKAYYTLCLNRRGVIRAAMLANTEPSRSVPRLGRRRALSSHDHRELHI